MAPRGRLDKGLMDEFSWGGNVASGFHHAWWTPAVPLRLSGLADRRLAGPRAVRAGVVAQSSPVIFLSHSGVDTEAARELKRRLENAPDARAAGLKVWFDKDDLRPGTSWSAQIAKAIQNEATAFVVYVGSGGVMNWVEAEVDLALSRATTDKQNPLLFIPALAAESEGSSALPPFAKRYQGVRDPLGDGDELGKLLKAVLDADWDNADRSSTSPSSGSGRCARRKSDRFFGRKAEIDELVEKFRKHRIVAIVADSGHGKIVAGEGGLRARFPRRGA